jgi:exonuclease-1
MGIPGMWPRLETVKDETKIHQLLVGQIIAVDASIWLVQAIIRHHSTYLTNDRADAVLDVRERVAWWVSRGVRPLLVIDGGVLPGKSRAHALRAALREAAEQELAMLPEMVSARDKGKLEKAIVRVNENFVVDVINDCREMGVDVVRAPFEADPQIAVEVLKGVAYAALTEDNDLFW